jgi:O-acetylhomoserine (thiol)-lyase
MSFDLKAKFSGIDMLNNANLVINATHLGDNRTLALPMASTIFFEMGPENRKAFGIGDQMIRCSIGIEETDDLLETFKQALDSI